MSSSTNAPFLEIQYHPANIRRGVRYFFLNRRQAQGVALATAALVALILVGIALVPQAAMNLRLLRGYEKQLELRAANGEHLARTLVLLEELDANAHRTRVEMSGIYLAYGFDESELRGQGGYPFQAERAPDSIYRKQIRYGNGLAGRVGEQLGVLTVFLDEVQSFEVENGDQVLQTPSTSPLKGDEFVLTSPFGSRRSPFTKKLDFHAGVDMAAPVGTKIRAPADGLVSFAGRYPLKQDVSWWRYGNMVALHHGDQFITLYGHCDQIEVVKGQRVRQGDVLATVGNTGWSTNPHLHYEIRRATDDNRFQPVDPRIYILDHRWRDHERLLVRARRAPSADKFEPLPRRIAR